MGRIRGGVCGCLLIGMAVCRWGAAGEPVAPTAPAGQTPDAAPAPAASDEGKENARIEAEISGRLIRVVLVPRREATLAAEASGKVMRLHYQLGGSFRAGDELVTLEDAFYLAALDKSKAALKAATVTLQSLLDLRTRNDASLTELENARRDVAAAQAELALAQRNFQACHVAAPYAGRVAGVFPNEQELVEPGRPLLRIIDDSVLLGHVFLPGALYSRIRDGIKIPLWIERGEVAPAATSSPAAKAAEETEVIARIPAVRTSGTFCRISPVIDPASGLFEAYVQIDNSRGEFRAGMEAWLRAEDLHGKQ